MVRVGLQTIGIDGVWLHRSGEYAEVLIERHGRWVCIVRERCDGNFSHIVEPAGIITACGEIEDLQQPGG